MSELLRKAQLALEQSSLLVQMDYRPAYHLSVPAGWLNDPNGFGFYAGRYHLFYQYHPYAPAWGPMHWGHWSSQDLVSWKVEPVALAPDQPYDAEGCFSGTSLAIDGIFYVVYTGVAKRADGVCIQQQCLAMSQDGVHFEKYAGNPIISSAMLPQGASETDFRDPKVFQAEGQFHMIVASRGNQGGQLLHYSSEDLFHWRYDGTFLTELGDMAECPDVFDLDGQTVVTVCLMNADAERFGSKQPVVYVAGKRNESSFQANGALQTVDQGMDFYAPQSVRLQDGRQIMIGWAFTWKHQWPIPEHGWAGMMTMPRECRLVNGTLFQRPLRELTSLRWGQSKTEIPRSLCDACEELISCAGARKEMLLTLQLSANARMMLSLMQTGNERVLLGYDVQRQQLVLDTSQSGIPLAQASDKTPWMQSAASLPLQHGRLTLHIFVDVSIIEVYVNDGQTAMTVLAFPKGRGYGVSLAMEHGGFLESCESWDMRPLQ